MIESNISTLTGLCKTFLMPTFLPYSCIVMSVLAVTATTGHLRFDLTKLSTDLFFRFSF
jgi:hypothetical protein